MPRVFRTRLTLAAERLGAFGEVPASSLASMLQEAATEASTDAGFPPEWYLREGTTWVIRRSTLELAQPIAAGAGVEISTWVADFRRVRSRREYEIRLPGSAMPSLVAHTDWVYVERGAFRPRRIPPDMIAAFAPERTPPALPREALAISAPPAGSAFESRRSVGPADLDALAHVNNARYFDFVEESAVAMLCALDWPPQRIRQSLADEAIVDARRHDVEYLDEARLGDELRCLSWVDGIEGCRFELMTEIRRATDDVRLTVAGTGYDCSDRGSGQPRELPDEFRAALNASRTRARSAS